MMTLDDTVFETQQGDGIRHCCSRSATADGYP
jgi:hypothetical protein